MTRAASGSPPMILGLGGGLRAGSSTEKALRLALKAVEASGARTALICGDALDLPLYAPDRTQNNVQVDQIVQTMRQADGFIIGSPGYHGAISGTVKNLLDYTEELRSDQRPYFEGRPVGSIATAAGWQGAVNTLGNLRAIVHALRGWNTPIGVAINTSTAVFDSRGDCLDPDLAASIAILGEQILTFLR